MDKTKIIVVEDNIVYCEFVCNLLAREGFRTVQAFHLSTAKKYLQQAANGDIVVSDLRLPGGLETVGEYAFSGCCSLEGVVLPAGMKTVGPYAFSDCQALEEVVISGGDTAIDAAAFSGCAVLTVLYYGGSDEQWTRWLAINSQDDWHPLADAQVITGFAVGNLNGQGEEPDAADVQCLYEYLATGEMTGRYKDSPMAFEAAANVNGVGGVDVYDLQRLYERAAKIA